MHFHGSPQTSIGIRVDFMQLPFAACKTASSRLCQMMRGWYGQAPRQPGQVRKEAAVTILRLGRFPTSLFKKPFSSFATSSRCRHYCQQGFFTKDAKNDKTSLSGVRILHYYNDIKRTSELFQSRKTNPSQCLLRQMRPQFRCIQHLRATINKQNGIGHKMVLPTRFGKPAHATRCHSSPDDEFAVMSQTCKANPPVRNGAINK